jgi:hypothetical protein
MIPAPSSGGQDMGLQSVPETLRILNHLTRLEAREDFYQITSPRKFQILQNIVNLVEFQCAVRLDCLRDEVLMVRSYSSCCLVSDVQILYTHGFSLPTPINMNSWFKSL